MFIGQIQHREKLIAIRERDTRFENVNILTFQTICNSLNVISAIISTYIYLRPKQFSHWCYLKVEHLSSKESHCLDDLLRESIQFEESRVDQDL